MTNKEKAQQGRFVETTLMGLVALIALIVLFTVIFAFVSWIYYT